MGEVCLRKLSPSPCVLASRTDLDSQGCNELLFHPIRFWPVRGPFTPLFKKFILSSMPFTSKITITAYVGTYYAIGAAWIMTTANYFAVGWFNGYLDKYYIDSWKGEDQLSLSKTSLLTYI